ncbi:MAG: hypothetical protein J2P17_09785, partial [Mycobacterium sp.]|nr:hypothetical protein [Mycobacterium sp.]
GLPPALWNHRWTSTDLLTTDALHIFLGGNRFATFRPITLDQWKYIISDLAGARYARIPVPMITVRWEQVSSFARFRSTHSATVTNAWDCEIHNRSDNPSTNLTEILSDPYVENIRIRAGDTTENDDRPIATLLTEYENNTHRTGSDIRIGRWTHRIARTGQQNVSDDDGTAPNEQFERYIKQQKAISQQNEILNNRQTQNLLTIDDGLSYLGDRLLGHAEDEHLHYVMHRTRFYLTADENPAMLLNPSEKAHAAGTITFRHGKLLALTRQSPNYPPGTWRMGLEALRELITRQGAQLHEHFVLDPALLPTGLPPALWNHRWTSTDLLTTNALHIFLGDPPPLVNLYPSHPTTTADAPPEASAPSDDMAERDLARGDNSLRQLFNEPDNAGTMTAAAEQAGTIPHSDNTATPSATPRHVRGKVQHFKPELPINDPQQLRAYGPPRGTVPLETLPLKLPKLDRREIPPEVRVVMVEAPDNVFEPVDPMGRPPGTQYQPPGLPKPGQVWQGFLGDCFLHAPAMRVAERIPHWLASLFEIKYIDNKLLAGMWWRDETTNKWELVRADLRFPLIADRRFSQVSGQSLYADFRIVIWAAILEQTYAIKFGDNDYANLVGGSSAKVFERLLPASVANWMGREMSLRGFSNPYEIHPMELGADDFIQRYGDTHAAREILSLYDNWHNDVVARADAYSKFRIAREWFLAGNDFPADNGFPDGPTWEPLRRVYFKSDGATMSASELDDWLIENNPSRADGIERFLRRHLDPDIADDPQIAAVVEQIVHDLQVIESGDSLEDQQFPIARHVIGRAKWLTDRGDIVVFRGRKGHVMGPDLSHSDTDVVAYHAYVFDRPLLGPDGDIVGARFIDPIRKNGSPGRVVNVPLKHMNHFDTVSSGGVGTHTLHGGVKSTGGPQTTVPELAECALEKHPTGHGLAGLYRRREGTDLTRDTAPGGQIAIAEATRTLNHTYKIIDAREHARDITSTNAAWWKGLAPHEKLALIDRFPHQIGDTDGVPPTSRDRANRLAISRDVDSLDLPVADALDQVQDDIRTNIGAFAELLHKLEREASAMTDPHSATDHPIVRVLAYDPAAFAGKGRFVVTLGDTELAESVSWHVEGSGTRISDMDRSLAGFVNLFKESINPHAGTTSPTTQVQRAGVLWIGYDHPGSSAEVSAPDHASIGSVELARALTAFITGRNISEQPVDRLLLIGHGYGSVTISWAVANRQFADLDGTLILVLNRSPGAGPARYATDFGIDPRHVFACGSSRGLVTRFGGGKAGTLNSNIVNRLFPSSIVNRLPHAGGRLGIDPTTKDFGAARLPNYPIPNKLLGNTTSPNEF